MSVAKYCVCATSPLGRAVRYCLAGHEPPVVYRARNGSAAAVEPGGLALGMLPSLRGRLEEIEIRGEHKALNEERSDLRALLKDAAKRWRKIADEIADIRREFGAKTALGRRRTRSQ